MTAAPVHEEPVITLESWAIMLVPGATAHIAGTHKGTRLRLSTKVVAFDIDAMTATTRSGRAYRLDGKKENGIGTAAVAIFMGTEAARESRSISPEELTLMLAEPANGWRA